MSGKEEKTCEHKEEDREDVERSRLCSLIQVEKYQTLKSEVEMGMIDTVFQAVAVAEVF